MVVVSEERELYLPDGTRARVCVCVASEIAECVTTALVSSYLCLSAAALIPRCAARRVG